MRGISLRWMLLRISRSNQFSEIKGVIETFSSINIVVKEPTLIT